jgi:hypothetical protein
VRRRRRRWDDADWVDPDDLVDGEDDLLVLEETLSAALERAPRPSLAVPDPPSRPSGWKPYLDRIAAVMRAAAVPWPAGREIQYVIAIDETLAASALALDVRCRQRKKNGDWRQLANFRLSSHEVSRLPDPADRQILATLCGPGGVYGAWSTGHGGSPFIRFHVPTPLLSELLPLIVRTGRATVWPRGDRSLQSETPGRAATPSPAPLEWDDGPPWEFRLDVRPEDSGRHYQVSGTLRREGERVDLAVPLLLHAGGVVIFPDRAARLDDGGAFAWIAELRRAGSLRVPAGDAAQFVGELVRMPRMPRHELPRELAYETRRATPRPRLMVHPTPGGWPPELLRLELAFDYDGDVIDAAHPDRNVFQLDRRRLIVRAPEVEAAARERLRALGVRERAYWPGRRDAAGGVRRDGRRASRASRPLAFWGLAGGMVPGLALAGRTLPRVVRTLLAEGWHVEADGRLYRQPGAFHLAVTTGIDWFELHGTVAFGDTVAHLPELLAALRRGESVVQLGDGTFGLLPEEWLRTYAPLATLGTSTGDHVRFTRTQVGLLDALLAARPEVEGDALLARARQELRRFEGIGPADPPPSFAGRLRGYQREGLGWLHFLRQFGFGGCLADDMGLGKTVMVLALLEARRAEGAKKPSLVVVPRSLVFNWKEEAARFAPGLSILDHTGASRRPVGEHFADHHVILTTYGTLRRDAGRFEGIEFEYVILDEAQAIKNPTTGAAKAARLLRGEHRLALSGTPIENHLGELWSLFEFLNPGMLGSARVLGLDGDAARTPDEAIRALLARALRPFILRRTKAQVAPELPPRTEQTVYCELEPLQRRLYNELRAYYRKALLERVDREGIRRSKIVILEALLRLRQAACHPGLIDRRRAGEPAGKLDVLLPRLQEVLAEGHKALVFSQFTSFLAIVRERLGREGIGYEYLDGQTRNRAARVARFQSDPAVPLFLVSLKAGGLGLNLTAAEHVFLLDPWWNPAAEAQAIDRAHRIGQSRHVLAFRLIARDTVEEKILALQAQKRELAEAIITGQNSLIRTLTREDLALLLS